MNVSKKYLSTVLFIFMVLGLVTARYLALISFLWLVGLVTLLILLLIFMLKHKKLFGVLIALMFFCLGIMLGEAACNKVKAKGLKKSSLSHVMTPLSDGLSQTLYSSLSKKSASFVETLLLGRVTVSRSVKQIFREAGTAHLLAISGMHVAIVASLIVMLLNFMRLPYKLSLVLASLFVLAFSVLCFNRPPVLRAALMFLVFSGFAYFQRPLLTFHSLAIAGIVSILLNPTTLFGISFQLSFVAVLFIMLGFKYFWPRRKFNYMINALLICFVVSFWAIVGTLPLVSYYFGKIYLLSWLSGTLTSPLLAFVIYGSVLLLIVSPFTVFAVPVALSLELLINFFIKANQAFASIPYMSINYRFSIIHVIIYYIAVLLIFFNTTKFYRKDNDKF